MTTWSEVQDGAVVLHKDAVFSVSRSGPVVSLTHLPEPCPRCPHAGRPAPDKAVLVLEAGHPRYIAPAPAQGRSVVVFDVETGDAEGMFRPNPGFVRLMGFAQDDGPVRTTTEVPTLLEALDGADEIVGHNILGFDLLALCHQHGLDWEAAAAKSRDMLILARLADPPRARDTGGSADRYDLDAVAAKLGVPGKSGDLKALKREFGGYDRIPADDPRYVAYLTADVEASRAVAAHLPMTRYGRREHKLASLAGRMTLNGFRVDVPLLERRIAEGEETKERALLELHDRFGLPLSRTVMRGRGKARHEEEEPFSSPLATTEGGAWWSAQVERFHWRRAPRTPKGKLSTSATDLAPVLTRKSCPPELAEIVRLMATVTQIRTVYQTVADCLAGDRVHSLINMGQASGRWSVTRPGLTVFGKRGGRHVEREIFLPEPGHVLLSCDLSQVDMRGIAGHCQDPNYMELFAPGKDVHTEIAIQIFGDASHRHDAKAIGHGANYGLGAKKMIAAGHDPEKVYAFFDGMAENFPQLISWRDELRERAARGELLDNGFGRLMRCDPERAYTQAPALMGQGSARDLLCDALLRLPEHFRPYLRAMIHDEVLISCPEQDAGRLGAELREAFTTTWRDVPIACDLSAPGRNWGDVSSGAHSVPGPEPEPARETVVLVEPEPVPEPVREVVVLVGPEPEPEPEPDPETAQETVVLVEPEPEPESEPTTPVYSDDLVTVRHGDCLDVLRTLPDASVDAVVTDPPYGLSELKPAVVTAALSAWLSGDREHVPDAKGFMGKRWDAFVPPPAVWDECLRVLKPGGHLLAFAGSRTGDLMGLSVRLAGFEIRDTITWNYASGFPKSLDVSKAIDKSAGAERQVILERTRAATGRMAQGEGGYAFGERFAVTSPATDAARQWSGWGTALKPAFEPIIVARKPLTGTVAATVLEHGTGALNIDACRVAGDVPSTVQGQAASAGDIYGADQHHLRVFTPHDAGRWPSNVVLSHAGACGPDDSTPCSDGCPVAELDRQSGVLKSGANPTRRGSDKFRNAYGDFAGQAECTSARGADSGTASRFFPTFRYQAKAPSKERPEVNGIKHSTVKPLALMQWLVKLITPPGGTVLEPFAGSGTTVEAAILEGFRVIAVEREADYIPLIEARISRSSRVTAVAGG